MSTGRRKRPSSSCKNFTGRCKTILLLCKVVPAEAGWPDDFPDLPTSNPVSNLRRGGSPTAQQRSALRTRVETAPSRHGAAAGRGSIVADPGIGLTFEGRVV